MGTATPFPPAPQGKPVQTSPDRAADPFLITLLNEPGLRLGEALGLRHGDLRLRAGEVRVVPRESNVNAARAKGLKARTVPIGTAVLDTYADYMESEYGTLDSDYVFVNLFRGPHGAPMTADSVKDLSKRLRRHSGVAHYSPHALRHTYATRLLRAKVPAEVVSELLGHASVQTTIDTYANPQELHLMGEKLQVASSERGLTGTLPRHNLAA
ncbi:tyrosine-type recombinase/integrase [Streptomyces sp. NPDC127084]|uniref:tyrosine-type recombinase/integrase n=1 Tax=Streptomyces sp. NPDC127084 TaxID=3347133 RepID=UPI003655EBDD